MRLTQQESPVVTSAFEGKHQVSECRFEGNPAVIIFIHAASARGKIQIMSKEKRRSMSGSFAVCDVQKEYIEHLFAILSEQLEGEYQFHLFHDPEKLTEFLEGNGAEVLLIGEEYRQKIRNPSQIKNVFILTEIMDVCLEGRGTAVFRYQSAGQILSVIRRGLTGGSPDRNMLVQDIPEKQKVEQELPDKNISAQKKGRKRIRDEPQIRGLIGVYSPVHRIGKTRFAIRTGQKLSEQVPVLYLNMEGYSGGSYYFPEESGQDLGDLIYCMKQERSDHGLKISSMMGQSGGMDYIMPMKNEIDLRAVRGEEWISLFDQILDKCIYEAVILDLGDCIDGLHDILRHCARIYTPYIRESASIAKLEQYERNLRTAGYGDVLSRTVKKLMQKRRHNAGRMDASP